jgi:hypothetical protein
MPSQHRSAAGSGRNTNRNLSALARKLSMEKPRYYRPHDVPSKADQRSEKDKAVATYTGKITKLKPGKAKGIKEDLAVPLLQGDSEGVEMVKAELKALANKAMHLVMQMPESMHVEPWCQAKIAQAKSMVSDVHDYMIYGDHKKPEEDEQTDTPMTFPNMSVDVNTGRNV